MRANNTVLAIDLGTSGCKCAIVTLSGETLFWAFEQVDTQIIGHAGAEQRPNDWWDAFLKTANTVVAKAKQQGLEIRAICASTQGEGTIAMNKEGEAISNCLTWLDMRGEGPLAKEANSGLLSVEGYNPYKILRWIQLTGGAPALSGKDGAGHMLFIKEAMPEVYEKTHRFLNVLDYINFRLTGRMAATRDSILTSWVTDNRDLNNIQYHDGLIRMLGIDREKLPEIIDCTDEVGTLLPAVAEQIGLSPSTVVIGGSIDFATAAIGSGAVLDGQVHLYIGTSSWMGAHMPNKKTSLANQIASVPCARNDRYLMSSQQSAAGSNLSFLRDNIFFNKDELLQNEELPDVYRILDEIANRVPPGARGLMYTPWLFGERTPVEDANLRAAFLNMSMRHTREDMIRSVMEGVALNTNWALSAVKQFLSGYSVDEITIIGGGGSSDVWCQIFADVMNVRIRQLENPITANVAGSAFIAGVGLGEYEFDDAAQLSSAKNIYQPDAAKQSVYRELNDVFLDAHKTLAPFYKRLNKNAKELLK